jgi:hypothetical protein
MENYLSGKFRVWLGNTKPVRQSHITEYALTNRTTGKANEKEHHKNNSNPNDKREGTTKTTLSRG